jgi:hypothetical protein
MITMTEIFNEIHENGGLTPSRKVKKLLKGFLKK